MNIHSTAEEPWLFSAAASHTPNALALARVGGPGGPTYAYTDDSFALGAAQGHCSTLAAGGRQWV